jgi:hypothetical protein
MLITATCLKVKADHAKESEQEDDQDPEQHEQQEDLETGGQVEEKLPEKEEAKCQEIINVMAAFNN